MPADETPDIDSRFPLPTPTVDRLRGMLVEFVEEELGLSLLEVGEEVGVGAMICGLLHLARIDCGERGTALSLSKGLVCYTRGTTAPPPVPQETPQS